MWSQGIYTFELLFVQMNNVPSRFWKLFSKDKPDLWRLVSFQMMPSKEAQALKDLKFSYN